MTKHNKAVRSQDVAGDDAGRNVGFIALIAILTVVGIAVWLIVNSQD